LALDSPGEVGENWGQTRGYLLCWGQKEGVADGGILIPVIEIPVILIDLKRSRGIYCVQILL
jgi:hypothetical protein